MKRLSVVFVSSVLVSCSAGVEPPEATGADLVSAGSSAGALSRYSWRLRHRIVDASSPVVDASSPVVDASSPVADAGSSPVLDAGVSSGMGCGSGGGGSSGGPADMFPCDSYWYKDVSALPAYTAVDYITGIGTWGASNRFMIDFSLVFMHAGAGTPKYSFALDSSYDPDNDHDPVPVPVGGSLEEESGYSCTKGGDCHLIVVDDAAHKLFELWQANLVGSTWTATQQTVWDLTQHYGPAGRGYGCTSADAAGMAVLPGLIGVREVAAGEIKHAIRFAVPQSHVRKNAYVYPATHSTGVYTGGVQQAPMGLRLRLKASFNEASLPSAGARVIARGLKKYGMLLADAGQYALMAESDQLESQKWAGVLAGGDLAAVHVSDFEAVDVGPVSVPSGMDCVRQ